MKFSLMRKTVTLEGICIISFIFFP